MDLQRAIEEAIGLMSDNYSVHPSGAIIIREGSERVQIYPKHINGDLWGWTYQTFASDGSVSVQADSVQHVSRMVTKIHQWVWTARRYKTL